MGCRCSRYLRQSVSDSREVVLRSGEEDVWEVVGQATKWQPTDHHSHVCEESGKVRQPSQSLEKIVPAASKRRRNTGDISPMAKRTAYFDQKCFIKASLSEFSTPTALTDTHQLMVKWSEDDFDVINNFWCDQPPHLLPNIPLQYHLGWNELDDNRFADPVGTLILSSKQSHKIHSWKRIDELEVPSCVADSRSGQVTQCVVYDNDGTTMSPGSPLKARIMSEPPRAVCIRQGFVGDCSFLSSLASLAEYENKNKIKVLSLLLYPQIKEENGQLKPIINKNGMYACRLYFNGYYRKVIIDDFVPTKKDGRILSAHTLNRRDMWVTLLEKAFIRLSGGAYYMHGSNPGADLFHLTGWLPETIPFRKELANGEDSESDYLSLRQRWDRVWNQLYKGFTGGSCVLCLGTSEIPDSAPSGLDFVEGVSISSGIVARHAYSVLNVVEYKGQRLLFVRNPWAVIRWKLQFAPGDCKSWTPDLENICNYDAKEAQKSDDGCFWIRWQDVVQWFSHAYLCWNAQCLPYFRSIDSVWGQDENIHSSILKDDSHLVAYNPQFAFKVQPIFVDSPSEYTKILEDCQKQPKHYSTTLWFLLSRHLHNRRKESFHRYIACHIFQGGRRQVCGSTAAHQGVYSNGECVLVRVDVLRPVVLLTDNNQELVTLWRNTEKECKMQDHISNESVGFIDGTGMLVGEEFVLVVSQYSQKGLFDFTLRLHSKIPTILRELPPLINKSEWHTLTLPSAWNRNNAGGCSNDLWAYFDNPHIRLSLPRSAQVHIILETIADVSVGLRLFRNRFSSARALRTGSAETSGSYRQGACSLDLLLEPGEHTIIPSTFSANQFVAFRLVCHVNLSLSRLNGIKSKEESMFKKVLPNGVALGYRNRYCPLRLVEAAYAFCKEPRWINRFTQSTMAPLSSKFILRPLQDVASFGARIQILSQSLSNNLIPALTVICVVKNGASFSLGEAGLLPLDWNRFASWIPVLEKSRSEGHMIGVLSYSDIEGGLSSDGETPSSAATRVYSKFRKVTLSCCTLYGNGNIEYYLDVSACPSELSQRDSRDVNWRKVHSLSHCTFTINIITKPNSVEVLEH